MGFWAGEATDGSARYREHTGSHVVPEGQISTDALESLLGAQFSLLPSEAAATALSATICTRSIPDPAVTANLVEQSVPLRKLLLRHISYGHLSTTLSVAP